MIAISIEAALEAFKDTLVVVGPHAIKKNQRVLQQRSR